MPVALGREAERPTPMVPNACTGRQLVGSSFFFFCQCYSHHLVCANQQLRTGSFLDAASQCVWARSAYVQPAILLHPWHVFIISSLFLVFCQCYSVTIWCVRIDSVRTDRFGDADSRLWPPSRACASGCCAITASVSRKHSKSWRCEPWLRLWELRWHRAVPAQSSR